MNILVLGSGRFGSIFKDYNSSSLTITVINSRALNISDIFSSLFASYDLVIDNLDPSSDSIGAFDCLFARNSSFRQCICNSAFKSPYVYLSSSNLYTPSSTIINELSPILSSPATDYLKLKSCSENILLSAPPNFHICRLPSLWSDHLIGNPKSFLDDIIYSRLHGTILPPRERDETVISYLKYSQVCDFFSLVTSFPKIFNLSSNLWSSRSCLKESSKFIDLSVSGHRITSIYPQFILPSFPL